MVFCLTRLFVNEHFTKKTLVVLVQLCAKIQWTGIVVSYKLCTFHPIFLVVNPRAGSGGGVSAVRQTGSSRVATGGNPTTWAHIQPTSTDTDFLTLLNITLNRNDHSLTYSISPMQTNCVGTLQPGQIYTNNTPTYSDFWTLLNISLDNRTRAIQ